MSGHYGNRKGGRGGCGGGNARVRGRYAPSKIHIDKTLEDCLFYVVSSKKTSDYEITAEFIVNNIKKTFDRGNDVSEALQTLVKSDTDLWKTTLNISSDTDASIKEIEDKKFVIYYQAEMDEAMRRKRTYEDKTYKSYALLWERCFKAIKKSHEYRTTIVWYTTIQ